jgi:hypothetical protein
MSFTPNIGIYDSLVIIIESAYKGVQDSQIILLSFYAQSQIRLQIRNR